MIDKIPKEKLFDFDESGIDLNINNEYGYIKKGTRLKVPRSGKRGKRLNILAARNYKNELLLPKIYETTIDKNIFKTYLKEHLFPNIPKGSYLILDNAKFHHDSKSEIADKALKWLLHRSVQTIPYRHGCGA